MECPTTVDVTTEIRKLPYSHVNELSLMLDTNDMWKNLMTIIPKTLEQNNYECKVSIGNPCKYHSEHFKLLENASRTMQKRCTELLFSEWGTSAKIRPTVGHLQYLLIKANLFRAAEYVAIILLNKTPPARPTKGPVAAVPDLNTQEIEKELDAQKYRTQKIEKELDAQKYHSSILSNLINDASNNVDVNLNYSTAETTHIPSIPKIVISEPVQTDSSIAMPLVIESRRRRMNRQNASVEDDATNSEVSDMIKFSRTEVDTESNSNNESSCDGIIPDISAIMSSDSDTNPTSENYLPNITTLDVKSDSSENYLPNITALDVKSDSQIIESAIGESSKESLPPISDLLEDGSKSKDVEPSDSASFMPNLSILGVAQQSDLIPPMSLLIGSSNTETSTDIKPPVAINIIKSEASFSMPQFSELLPSKKSMDSSDFKHFLPITDHGSDTSSYGSSKNSNASSNMSHNSNLSQRSDLRPKCVSPLPNLSLNTPLPHCPYYEVETATNNFNETPYKNCLQVENPLVETNGRFLGAGAFASVFLGLGIGNKPVAVKKLKLNNMDVVDIDDPVTKQFKNEVEVLSKYQHENLLSLVGYSCDGPTYCLLYEFMPGGALKDRLQNVDEKLIWTDRLYIALGTARAVTHLHTAYSTPLIHRDVKTANILLDCTNKPKLCDFGLIKLLSNQNTNTSTTAFGTSAYMAREAFSGDASIKLDTYSFGVVLLELITSLPPLDENREGLDIVTHVEEVCEDDSIAPLTDLKAGSWVAKDINFAEELFKISTKCLTQNRKQRPAMVEITKALTELIKQCA